MFRGAHLGWRHGTVAIFSPKAHYYAWFINSMVGKDSPHSFKQATVYSAEMGLGREHTILSAFTLLAAGAFLVVFMGVLSPLAPLISLGGLAVAGISAGIVFVAGVVVTWAAHQIFESIKPLAKGSGKGEIDTESTVTDTPGSSGFSSSSLSQSYTTSGPQSRRSLSSTNSEESERGFNQSS